LFLNQGTEKTGYCGYILSKILVHKKRFAYRLKEHFETKMICLSLVCTVIISIIIK